MEEIFGPVLVALPFRTEKVKFIQFFFPIFIAKPIDVIHKSYILCRKKRVISSSLILTPHHK